MKTTCAQWKDQLLDAAMDGAVNPQFQNHLSECVDCRMQLRVLRTRNQRLESLLPLLAKAEPSPDLSARILASAEVMRRSAHFWRGWALAGSLAAILIAVMAAFVIHRGADLNRDELRKAQALAQWHAPTDFLLRIPGQELLNSTPRLGEPYLKIPITTEKEKSK